MALNWAVEWDPFREFERLQEELDRLFEWVSPFRTLRGEEVYPRINVGETPEEVLVYIFAPGVDPKSVELSLEGNLLSVSGERRAEEALGVGEVKPERFVRQERFSGKFSRVISLPESVDPEQVEAEYRNGLIVVRIGKKAERRARKIEVKGA